MKQEFYSTQKFEILNNTAHFKYTQKLIESSFKSIEVYTVKKRRAKELREKGNKVSWLRLATMGLSLFIKNSIHSKKKMKLESKVRM